MVVSTINKESFKEPMTSCAVAAADIHSSVELPPLTWSTLGHAYVSLGNYASKANNKGKHSVGKVGRGGESPPSLSPPPSSFLHLALHDVIQAALAVPLWDQRKNIDLNFIQ